MTTSNLSWKLNIWTGCYTIYADNDRVGYLKRDGWFTRSKTGKIHDKTYHFKVKGILCTKAEVFDADGSKIGEVDFHGWRFRATYEYLGEVFEWKYKNFWMTSWKFMKGMEERLSTKNNLTKGVMVSGADDQCLALTGLFISSFYYDQSHG